MDAAFELLLPIGTDLSSLNFEVPSFEWDSVVYPQGPPECQFGSNFSLKVLERYNFDYVKARLPEALQAVEWMAISVQGEGMDAFNSQLYGLGIEEVGFSLSDLLNIFLGRKVKWIAVFEPEFDGFSEVKEGNVESILKSLENSIKTSRKGFLIYCIRMKLKIDSDFLFICKQILLEDRTLDEWKGIESDDMFENGAYVGGFEAAEMEFCFSVFDEGKEYWFQVSLNDIKDIVDGKRMDVEAVEADQ